MNTITKPMLASKCERPDLLPFPVLATPKLDGIRCLKIGGKALSRSFKPISNRFAREWIEANLPDGVDGELMLRGGTFSETASAIGARDGQPDFVFHVFDIVVEGSPPALRRTGCGDLDYWNSRRIARQSRFFCLCASPTPPSWPPTRKNAWPPATRA